MIDVAAARPWREAEGRILLFSVVVDGWRGGRCGAMVDKVRRGDEVELGRIHPILHGPVVRDPSSATDVLNGDLERAAVLSNYPRGPSKFTPGWGPTIPPTK